MNVTMPFIQVGTAATVRFLVYIRRSTCVPQLCLSTYDLLIVLASSAAQFSTLPGPPEAPSAPVAIDVESSRIALGWRPPTHDGGSLVVSYRLEVIDLLSFKLRTKHNLF